MKTIKTIALICMLTGGLLLVSGCCQGRGGAGKCGQGAKCAAKADKTALCPKCGEVEGSEKCCAAGAEVCAKCGMHKGSPGCCK